MTDNMEEMNYSENNYGGTNYVNQNGLGEKDLIIISQENKYYKHQNFLLVEKLKEMERKIKILSMNLEEDICENYDKLLIEKESKIHSLEIKREELQIELETKEKKVENLEAALIQVMQPEAININSSRNEIYKYFVDSVMKQIEAREKEKQKNKLLLEKVIVLLKRIKNK